VWVRYREKSDSAMPGSGQKNNTPCGHIPVRSMLTVREQKHRFVLTYRCPDNTLGELILAPLEEDVHVRGRGELMTALRHLIQSLDSERQDQQEPAKQIQKIVRGHLARKKYHEARESVKEATRNAAAELKAQYSCESHRIHSDSGEE